MTVYKQRTTNSLYGMKPEPITIPVETSLPIQENHVASYFWILLRKECRNLHQIKEGQTIQVHGDHIQTD